MQSNVHNSHIYFGVFLEENIVLICSKVRTDKKSEIWPQNPRNFSYAAKHEKYLNVY